MICTKSFNILFYDGHVALNYTSHVVYSPLNSYVYIPWILDFKYILLLLTSATQNPKSGFIEKIPKHLLCGAQFVHVLLLSKITLNLRKAHITCI